MKYLLLVLILALPAMAGPVFVATAYHTHGLTRDGHVARKGYCAVDPHVIPLGSRVHVKGIGWLVATDTGHNIKGKRIDVWLPTAKRCKVFGRHAVQVLKIKRPTKRRLV